MLVEFGFFDGDTLLERNAVRVTSEAQCVHLKLFNVAHPLSGEVAKIVFSNFAPEVKLKSANLDMPVHESPDWESIELARDSPKVLVALICRHDVLTRLY